MFKAMGVSAVLLTATITGVQAEDFLGVYGGWQFGPRATNTEAFENFYYPSQPNPDLVDQDDRDIYFPVTVDDPIVLEDNFTFGIRFGRYFQDGPGFGVEIDKQFSNPDFPQQDVSFSWTDGPGGSGTRAEDQLPAGLAMFNLGINGLYRAGQPGEVRPYFGAGPAIFLLHVTGTGDSCKLAGTTDPYCPGPDMDYSGFGYGANAKAGFEAPISDNASVFAEYKFTIGRLMVDQFRSLDEIETTFTAHSINAGILFDIE
jgi:hypothetical protein